jgi:transposase
LTRQRTQLKNRVHALLARYDLPRPSGSLFTKKGMEFLRQAPVRPFHRQILDDSLAALEHFNTSIKALDKRLAHEAAQRADARLLMSMPAYPQKTP